MRLTRVERPANYIFDERLAGRAVRFIEEFCVHTKGRFAGQPFILRDWQKQDLREVFGRVDENGFRQIRTVFEFVPKKNGKSEKVAAVALKLAFADDEFGAEIYSGAADREQASIVFDVAAQMVRLSPELARMAKVRDSTKRIIVPAWNTFYRAISSKVAGKHGYNSHGVIFDEVHAQENMDLWEVLTVGAGAARTQPLTWAVTTAGVAGQSPVAEMLYDQSDRILRGIEPCPSHFYPIIYQAPEDAPWDDEDTWRTCNPALGDFLDPRSLREDCEDAKRRPSQLNMFLRMRLNRWVKQVNRWIRMDLWDADECKRAFDWRDLRNLTWYAGLDLSTKLDITAFVLVARDESGVYWVIPYFWIPKDNLQDRPNMEADKYRHWLKKGHMATTEGNVIDFATIRQRIREIGKELKIREIAFDPMFASQLAQQLTEDGFLCVEMRQTFRTFTEPMHEFEGALSEGRIRHGGNPVLRWMADCTDARQRADGATRPEKPDRKKATARIDGIVAMLMAIARVIVAGGERRSIFDLMDVGALQ